MKYRCIAFAAVPYGSGRASMRASSCLYCFFCSSDPVRVSIHLAAMSVLSFVELFDSLRQEVPGCPELRELLPALGIDRIDLAWRALLGRDLLHVHEAPLLDAHQQRVDGALDQVGE